MLRIFKYTLDTIDEQVIKLPEFYKILSLKVQNNTPRLYVLINDKIEEEKEIRIRIYGTGHPVDEVGEFIGTYQLSNGQLVFHAFIV